VEEDDTTSDDDTSDDDTSVTDTSDVDDVSGEVDLWITSTKRRSSVNFDEK
jgi:hypothetical protein